MFIGEGPGETEDNTGRPFVGKAGQLLEKRILAIGLTREDVYIANMVKCRPPKNRDPEQEETETCIKHLREQVTTVPLASFKMISITYVPLGAPLSSWKIFSHTAPSEVAAMVAVALPY